MDQGNFFASLHPLWHPFTVQDLIHLAWPWSWPYNLRNDTEALLCSLAIVWATIWAFSVLLLTFDLLVLLSWYSRRACTWSKENAVIVAWSILIGQTHFPQSFDIKSCLQTKVNALLFHMIALFISFTEKFLPWKQRCLVTHPILGKPHSHSQVCNMEVYHIWWPFDQFVPHLRLNNVFTKKCLGFLTVKNDWSGEQQKDIWKLQFRISLSWTCLLCFLRVLRLYCK